MLLIGIQAALTYPDLADTQKLVVGTHTSALDAQSTRIDTWFGHTKDLVQLLVVSLLIPLLATLLGYIFGRTRAGEEAS